MLILLLLSCSGSEAETDLPTSGTLSMLTYNVHGLPDAITGDDTTLRMELIAPLLDDFQVVGLQEDFDDDDHAVMVAESTHPVQERFSETVDDGRVYGSGLSLLAIGEAALVEGVHYSACNGITDGASDCLASKGFLYVQLDVPGVRLHLYDTHMEAGNGEADDEARDVQVEELLAHMEDNAAGEPIVFMGDTNLHDSDPEDLVAVERMKDWGLRDSCDEVDCDDPGRIDRFMVRDGGEVALTVEHWEVAPGFVGDTGVDFSDHEPIAIDLGWSTE